MSKVSIYKASAGSGKTFRLTIEYLKIVLSKPFHYKKVLAITFTNKATAEMKSRILEQLHELSQGKAIDYATILSEELQLSATEIKERARQAEQYILHDYNRFSVMTIDAFFQTILKAFAKELGVAYNYNVELDIERIKRLAIERMFAELDENTDLRSWLRSYVQDKIRDGRSWDIAKDILTLSQQMFQESFFFTQKSELAKWSNKEFVKRFSQRLRAYMEDYEKGLKRIGEEAYKLIEGADLKIDDFTQKQRGVAGFFHKLATGQIVVEITSSYHHKPIDNPGAWCSKTTKPEIKQRIAALYPELNALLKKLHDWVNVGGSRYQSCDLVRKNLYVMGIFSDMARHIYEILHEEEKILLSESNKLLYEMIANNEVPFIYEKTGNQYLYFLWDEFQDTSQMQWHNLKPLLANAIAEGNPCLIVGDVKQAIYRWRNSDWEILGTQVATSFTETETITMQHNWRSRKAIVAFNNALYSLLPKALEEHLEAGDSVITALYKDADQIAMRNKTEEGYVHFSYLQNSEVFTDRELILNELPKWVEQIQQSGVSAEDIVFLVRKNEEAVAIADYFTKLKERKDGINYNVVSEYALLLENSLVVKILITALYFYQTKEAYYEVFLEKLMPYLSEGNEKFKTWKQYAETKRCCTSLDQLVQRAIRVFKLAELGAEELYLMAFEEFVNTTIQKQNANLNDFLLIWEADKRKLSITPDEQIPAMRIMTVHKAKGLEFHTVILPFVDKNLEGFQSGENLWQKADFSPLNEVSSLLIPFEKKLQKSTFAQAYNEEMCRKYIDELNVLYVATTRAVCNLIMIGVEKSRGTFLSGMLYKIIEQAQDGSFFAEHWQHELREWSYGSLVSSEQINKKKIAVYAQQSWYYEDYLKKFPLKVSSVDDAKRVRVDALTPIEEGNIWHLLLQNIKYISDIPVAVNRAYYDGLITQNAQQSYATHLKELLSRSTICDYYTDAYEIWNERPLWIDGETYIPDRVVRKNDELVIIEYKFGESHTQEHKKQVQKYIDFFKKKEYLKVRCYLIYGVFSEIILV